LIDKLTETVPVDQPRSIRLLPYTWFWRM